MIRVAKKSTGTYTLTSVPADFTNPTITGTLAVSLADGAGTVVATATPTQAAGVLTWSVPVASLPYLDSYTATYTATVNGAPAEWVDDIELVGGFHFSLAQLRAFDRAFTDTVKYPDALLEAVRVWVEDVIEGPRAAQLAFVPRHSRVRLDGTAPDLTRGWSPLMYGGDYRGITVPDFAVRRVISVTIGGIPLSEAELAALQVDDNQVWRPGGVQWPAWPYGHKNVVMHYEHGLDRAPGGIPRAALLLAREYLAKSDLPGRATATSIGDQMFRLTIAGRDGVTGLPEVDAAISQWGRNGYGIG